MFFPLLLVCDYDFLIALVCWSLPRLPWEGGEGPNSALLPMWGMLRLPRDGSSTFWVNININLPQIVFNPRAGHWDREPENSPDRAEETVIKSAAISCGTF